MNVNTVKIKQINNSSSFSTTSYDAPKEIFS